MRPPAAFSRRSRQARKQRRSECIHSPSSSQGFLLGFMVAREALAPFAFTLWRGRGREMALAVATHNSATVGTGAKARRGTGESLDRLEAKTATERAVDCPGFARLAGVRRRQSAGCPMRRPAPLSLIARVISQVSCPNACMDGCQRDFSP